MKYLKKLTHYSTRYSGMLKNCFPPKVLDKLNEVFHQRGEEGIEEDSPSLQYYQMDEPYEFVHTQTRLKVPHVEKQEMLGETTECGGIQDTKIAKQNGHKSHFRYKWIFNVISGLDQGRQYLATTPEVKIGRKPDNHICLKDPKVSRFHASIRLEGVSLVLKDLQSTNGTSVNGEKIVEEQRLFSGDQFKVGDTIIQIVSETW